MNYNPMLWNLQWRMLKFSVNLTLFYILSSSGTNLVSWGWSKETFWSLWVQSPPYVTAQLVLGFLQCCVILGSSSRKFVLTVLHKHAQCQRIFQYNIGHFQWCPICETAVENIYILKPRQNRPPLCRWYFQVDFLVVYFPHQWNCSPESN